MAVRALDVANYFIQKGVDNQCPITAMKLHKLLYYAQGYYLGFNDGEALFLEDFKKWPFGPVCPAVYNKFRNQGAKPITRTHKDGHSIKDPGLRRFLDVVWEAFGGESAATLSKMSHEEAPWLRSVMYEVISKEKLLEFFSDLLADPSPAPAAS